MSKQLIRIKAVIELTGTSKSYIYKLVEKKRFPTPIKLQEDSLSVAWVKSEVEQWIQDRIDVRDGVVS